MFRKTCFFHIKPGIKIILKRYLLRNQMNLGIMFILLDGANTIRILVEIFVTG